MHYQGTSSQPPFEEYSSCLKNLKRWWNAYLHVSFINMLYYCNWQWSYLLLLFYEVLENTENAPHSFEEPKLMSSDVHCTITLLLLTQSQRKAVISKFERQKQTNVWRFCLKNYINNCVWVIIWIVANPWSVNQLFDYSTNEYRSVTACSTAQEFNSHVAL